MRKRKKNKKKAIVLLLVCTLFIIVIYFIYKNYSEQYHKNNLIEEISSHYNEFVRTNKDSILYNDKGEEVGKIGNNVELILNAVVINKDTKYFPLKDLDGYYIRYSDVDKIDERSLIDDRYKNYLVFNKNIVTNEKTSFYDNNGNLIYELNESFSLPIIINDSDNYGVEFNNRLLYVKKEDVKEVIESHNTDRSNASGIGVLNYHAFYDENNDEEKRACNTSICHSKSQFKQHLDYFRDNNILTLRMNEVEMYIDGKIQLPKSVLLTIDDGGRTQVAIDLLTEYKMYATIFLVTSWYDPSDYYTTEYIELHSHSHAMHETGACPIGQGGGIQCLPEKEILDDLKTSREKLNGTTYFCYPFYEYNDYSIRMLKEAGFTMAFIGESNYSDNLVHVGSDKFKLRRFVIVTYTKMSDLDNYFNQIK